MWCGKGNVVWRNGGWALEVAEEPQVQESSGFALGQTQSEDTPIHSNTARIHPCLIPSVGVHSSLSSNAHDSSTQEPLQSSPRPEGKPRQQTQGAKKA
jgi:hypothetical protein